MYKITTVYKILILIVWMNICTPLSDDNETESVVLFSLNRSPLILSAIKAMPPRQLRWINLP